MENECLCGSKLPFNLCCEKKYKSLHYDYTIDIDTASKYELWSYARVALWQSLVAQIREMPDTINEMNIIIFGAGACNDLPIDFICDTFKEIVLVDIDKEALSKSKDNIPSNLSHKVSTVCMDVTGLMAPFTNTFLKNKLTSFHDGINFLNQANLSTPILPNEIKNKGPFTFVLSDLLLTQICNFFITVIRTLPNKNNTSTDLLVPFIDNIIYQHLNMLREVVSPSGQIMVLTDTFTLGIEVDGTQPAFNKALIEYGNSINNPNETMIGNWFRDYRGISGSNILYTIYKNNFDKVKYKKMYYWWWQFSANRKYFVINYILHPQ